MKKDYYRYCIVNKEKYHITSLIRLTLNSNKEVIVDLSYCLGGRGVYFKKDIQTLNKLIDKKMLSRVFKTNVKDSTYDEIYKIVSEVIDNGEEK